MRMNPALPLIAAGLVLSTAAFAQNSPDGPAPAPPLLAGGQSQRLFAAQTPTTQSSRIRAFNAGSDGQVRSLYLQNGSVVNVPPDLGLQLSARARKGAHIRVTGTRTTVNGQRIIMANQITMSAQTYTAQAQALPGDRAGLAPGAGPGVAPPPPTSLARLNGPGDPRPGGGPIPPPPPAGPDARPGAHAQSVPPPPPGQGGPARPDSGPQQRNLPVPPPSPSPAAVTPNQSGAAGQPNPNSAPPPPPASPAQSIGAGASGQPNTRTPQPPDADSPAPASGTSR